MFCLNMTLAKEVSYGRMYKNMLRRHIYTMNTLLFVTLYFGGLRDIVFDFSVMLPPKLPIYCTP